ncbi:MAG TPA: septal ring lytic transglycosylase RlpA family protein [Candidatus Kapabacteria bacterium]|nr:septal ring lytic transglycosylase RlpA family protein [Candidatus Kapabacteria bacterium]
MKIKLLFLFIIILIIQSCSGAKRFSSASQSEGKTSYQSGDVFRGLASFYSDEFEGRQTANGEIYNKNKFTAAHKTISFGTKIKIRNLQNNLTTIVVINDRGPFVQGRVIDLSRAAAEQIGMIQQGVVEVEITIIE